MKSYFLKHFFRCEPDLLSPMRRVWMAGPGGPGGGGGALPGAPTSGPAPAAVPSARTALEDFTLELTRLKNDLDEKGMGTSLMKFAEEHGDDTSDWQKNPASAVKFFKDYRAQLIASTAEADMELRKKHIQPTAFQGSLDKLITALQTPDDPSGRMDPSDPTKKLANPEFLVAKEIILQIAEYINARKSAISEAKKALGDLNENAVTGKIENFVENAYHTYERMSMPEKAATIGAIFMFFKMAPSDKDGNMVFGPLVKIGVGATLANLVTQVATGKSGVDHIAEKFGLERFLPTASDQLPEFMKALALKTSRDKGVDITMPSELVAMGKLGEQKMSSLMAVYDPTGDSIDPAIFGLRPAKDNDTASGDITPKHLYMIVDTLVKKNKTTGTGTGARGDKQAFMLEYCSASRHDFTFAEAISDLFQAESMQVIHDSMTQDEWNKYKKVVESDTYDMWQKDNVGMDCRPEVRRYGVKFYGLTYLTKQRKSSDGNRYTYQIGDDKRVTVGVKDSIMTRKESANLLKEKTKAHIWDTIKLHCGSSSSPLVANSNNLQWTGNTWELRDVPTASSKQTLILEEHGNGGDFRISWKDNPSKSAKLDKDFAGTGAAALDL